MNKYIPYFLIVALVLLVPVMAFSLPGPHDPTSGKGYVCNTCHTSGQTVGHTDARYSTNVCFRCHSDAVGVANKAKSRFHTEDFANPFGTTTVVQTTKKQTSHKWFGPDVRPQAGALAPVDTAINGLNKNSNFLGNIFCARCHNVHGTSGIQSMSKPYLRFPNDQDQMCLNCHRPRNTTDHKLGTHPVNISYTSASAKLKIAAGTLLPQPLVNVVNPTAQVKLIKGKVVCSTCHGVHNTDSRSTTFDPFSSTHTFGQLSASKGYLLRVDAYGKNANNDPNICTNCHAGKANHNPGSRTGPFGNATKPVQCNDCHSGHVEYDAAATGAELIPNKNLVRRYLQYTTAGRPSKRVFYRYTGSTTREFYNAAGKGLCQSCHFPPSNHYVGSTRTGSFPDPGYGNCNSCHKHGTLLGSFSYDSGSCATNDCHGLPPASNIAGAGGRASGYTTFDEGTTPHVSHSAGGGSNDFECFQCHQGAGTVMPASNGIFNEVFIDRTNILAGPTATYTGFNCNNVYCHSTGRGTWKPGMNPIAWGNNLRGTIIGQPTECSTCHDAPNSSQSHQRHVDASPAGMGYGCVLCHSATVSNNTTLLASAKASGGTHSNAIKDVQYSGTGAAIGTTCANIACHSNSKGAAPIEVPVWGTASTGQCGDCHRTNINGLATGGHTTHFTLIGGTDPVVICSKCHTYNGETLAPHVNGTLNVNFDATGCAANLCHGSITAPVWTTAYAGRDACTKCHGKLTNTGVISAANNNRYLVAPQYSSAEKGKVSPDIKVGAHQTHLRYLNGFSSYSTVDYRCQTCHGSPLPATGSHANSSSAPTFPVTHLAGNRGAMSPSFGAGSCTNTYCHNPAGVGGTLANPGSAVAPSWNNSAYLDDTGKNQVNCGKCHKVPGDAGFTKQAAHGAFTTIPAIDCSGCHGHNGDNAGGIGQRHMDGKFYGDGSCDACHGYPPMNAAQLAARAGTYINAALENYAGGGGFHPNHLLPTVVATMGFTPCEPCHPNSSAGFHQQGGSVVSRANISVNIPSDTGYRFDSNRAKRYNSTAHTCSNVSCHFKPTPAWF